MRYLILNLFFCFPVYYILLEKLRFRTVLAQKINFFCLPATGRQEGKLEGLFATAGEVKKMGLPLEQIAGL
jgi:hypothetical protein